MDNNENTKLTDEQVEQILEVMDDNLKESESLSTIASLPSNNGVEESTSKETGSMKKVKVTVDPVTGEHAIVGGMDEEDGTGDNETFEEMCARLENELDTDSVMSSPLTKDDMSAYVNNKDNKQFSMLSSIQDELTDEEIMKLLEITNRRIAKEEFNIYKEFPEKIQNLIDDYAGRSGVTDRNTYNRLRNAVSDSIIDEFITNIKMEKATVDLNKEIETLFEKGSGEIADTIIGYTKERNEKYREYANGLDDEDKKEKLNGVLDSIEEAYNLTQLKEFAKKCKIKKIEVEKPDRQHNIIDSFLRAYDGSKYNIYNIYSAESILARHFKEEFTIKDIRAFFILFCKQCLNYSPNDALQHAYMYYVMYNIVLVDVNKGNSKEVSDKFLDNIREVINNLKVRNNI